MNSISMEEILQCKLGVLVIIACRDGVEKRFRYIAEAAEAENEETNGDDQGDIDQ